MMHFRACHLCEAMCGLTVDVDGNKVVSILGDRDDSLSRGYFCPKAKAISEIHSDPDRLRAPVKRLGDKWEQVSWEDALNELPSPLSSRS